MKKTLMTMAVLALGGLMSTQAATAAPFAKAAGATQGVAISDVEQVRDRKHGMNKSYQKRRGYKNRGYKNRGYNNWRSDRRYYGYRNYNRYYSRPYNWRSRGCVSVGPVWFCK